MFKHILVPVDLGDTPAADKAVNAAKRIARRDGARISIISVVPAWPEDLASEPYDYQPDLDAYIETIREGLDIVGEVKITGSVNGRIIEAVEGKRIDLIAIASHNPWMTDYLIGSHAAHVVMHAPCTVLVVS